jgi:SAM-dependent methyltransferase
MLPEKTAGTEDQRWKILLASAEQMTDLSNHYDDAYFRWQSELGLFTGQLEAIKFNPFLSQEHALLDFGCGGGFLLAALDCKSKLGVEINSAGRRSAAALGIATVPALDDVPNSSIDVAISNHALEHVSSPLDVLKGVFAKLKPGGIAVFVVPCERYDTAYMPGNVDQHLYTWSPMNLGNLFRHSGFDIHEVKRIPHRWPPFVRGIDRIAGRAMCNLICEIYGRLRPKMTQIRIVARRPSTANALDQDSAQIRQMPSG